MLRWGDEIERLSFLVLIILAWEILKVLNQTLQLPNSSVNHIFTHAKNIGYIKQTLKL